METSNGVRPLLTTYVNSLAFNRIYEDIKNLEKEEMRDNCGRLSFNPRESRMYMFCLQDQLRLKYKFQLDLITLYNFISVMQQFKLASKLNGNNGSYTNTDDHKIIFLKQLYHPDQIVLIVLTMYLGMLKSLDLILYILIIYFYKNILTFIYSSKFLFLFIINYLIYVFPLIIILFLFVLSIIMSFNLFAKSDEERRFMVIDPFEYAPKRLLMYFYYKFKCLKIFIVTSQLSGNNGEHTNTDDLDNADRKRRHKEAKNKKMFGVNPERGKYRAKKEVLEEPVEEDHGEDNDNTSAKSEVKDLIMEIPIHDSRFSSFPKYMILVGTVEGEKMLNPKFVSLNHINESMSYESYWDVSNYLAMEVSGMTLIARRGASNGKEYVIEYIPAFQSLGLQFAGQTILYSRSLLRILQLKVTSFNSSINTLLYLMSLLREKFTINVPELLIRHVAIKFYYDNRHYSKYVEKPMQQIYDDEIILSPIKIPYSNYYGPQYVNNNFWFVNEKEARLKEYVENSLKDPVVTNLVYFTPHTDWIYYGDNEHNRKAALARLMEQREDEEKLTLNDFSFLEDSPMLRGFIDKLNKNLGMKISVHGQRIYFPAPRAGKNYSFYTSIDDKDYFSIPLRNQVGQNIKDLYDIDHCASRSLVTTFYELQEYLLSSSYAKGLMKFLGYTADVILSGAETIENVLNSGYRYIGDFDLMRYMSLLPTPKGALYRGWIKELFDIFKIKGPVVWDLQLKIEPAKFRKFPRLYAKKDRLVLRDRIIPDLLKFLDNEETTYQHEDLVISVKFCPANSLESADRTSHRLAVEWCMELLPNQMKLVNFSDDVIYSFMDEHGNKYFGEGDISKADASIRFPTLFIMYHRIAKLLDEDIAFDLISPLFAPSQLSTHDGRRIKLKPIFGYLYSGHCLTTALNNLNVKKGVCGVMEHWIKNKNEYLRAGGLAQNLPTFLANGFKEAGIVLKVEPKTNLSSTTFLKISLINNISVPNLGPLFRKLGRYQDGLSHIAFNMSKKEFDKKSYKELLELHLKTVVETFKYEPHTPLHNALRSRIGLEPMETIIHYSHLSERYPQISLSEWIELESILHTLQVGHVYHSSAVKSILAVDYGNTLCEG